MTRSNKQGFTLVELLVVIAILGILIGLMLPAIQSVREAARKAQCTSQIRQLVLAAHTYHDKQKKLPPSCHKIGEATSGTTTASTLKPDGYSWLADLLPSMEQQALYDQFKNVFKGSPNDAQGANTIKGVEQDSVKEGISRRIPLFLCPSTTKTDGIVEYESSDRKEGITNYVTMGATTAKSLKLSVEEGKGSEWDDTATKPDGATYPGSKTTLESMKDGTANTIYACETADEYRRWAVGSDASVVALPTSESGAKENVISPKKKGEAAGDGVKVKFGFLAGWTPGKYNEESTVDEQYSYLDWDYDYDTGDGSYKDVVAEAATQNVTGPCSEAESNTTRKGVSSYHSGVIIHAMADASVFSISTDADPQIYMFMTTANAGDPAEKP